MRLFGLSGKVKLAGGELNALVGEAPSSLAEDCFSPSSKGTSPVVRLARVEHRNAILRKLLDPGSEIASAALFWHRDWRRCHKSEVVTRESHAVPIVHCRAILQTPYLSLLLLVQLPVSGSKKRLAQKLLVMRCEDRVA